jgi:hypothetical protein
MRDYDSSCYKGIRNIDNTCLLKINFLPLVIKASENDICTNTENPPNGGYEDTSMVGWNFSSILVT